MKIAFTQEIPAQRIADLVVSAVEGNHMTRSWCTAFHLKRPGHGDLTDKVWYADPALYERDDFQILVQEDANDDGKGDTDHLIGPAELCKGFQLMATKYPAHFADFISENEDAVTADVFLQCVALGELVYG